MTTRRFILVPAIVAAALGLLVACGGDENRGSSASTADIGQGLAPGEFEIDIVGRVRSVGPYSGDRVRLRYSPSTYGSSRERRDGTGGRERVVATNDEGPYSLMMRMDLQRGDEEPDRETGHVTIQLPPGARAGQTYPLETFARARHGEAFVQFGGYGQSLNIGGSGTISIAEIGERLSLQFEFSGGDEAEGNYRHIRGRAYQIPLTRNGEAHYQLLVDGQREDRVEFMRFRNDWSIQGPELSFDFPGDVARPGTFQLANRRGPGVVSVSLQNHRGLDFSGSIDVVQDGEIWSATFEFEGEGDVSIRGQGSFDHLQGRPAHR
ncbi:MAG: hypothetical protein EA418_12420 [Wenzhouxiangellaceae bacterium]|nr:MAG: hypothetical protein EA418_12420 [Wenzhouxiangellaceae bacterium]